MKLLLSLLLLTSVVFAEDLQSIRKEVVAQYLTDLESGHLDHMITLFEENGTVMSTSKGQVDAKVFFTAFLPHIVSGKIELHQFFAGDDADHFAVRFGLYLMMDDGWSGYGEYMDDFIFAPNSEKLSAVYMFENTHFVP